MPQHYGNKKKRRSGDPNLEPGVAAATRRSQRTRKAAPTKKSPRPRRLRTSDQPQEIRLISTTKATPAKKAELQRILFDTPKSTPKAASTIENRLVPNIGTPVKRLKRRRR
jgi:hypothetical protein